MSRTQGFMLSAMGKVVGVTVTRHLPASLIAAIGLLTLAACGGSSSGAQPTGTSTATVVASPQSSSASPSSPSSSSPATPTHPVVTGAGSTLTAPAAPTTKSYTAHEGEHCHDLIDAHFDWAGCEQFTSKLGKAVALVETHGKQERDLVYTVSGDKAHLALRRERQIHNDASASVQVSDLASDHTKKAIFTLPDSSAPSGSGQSIRDLDVVEANGKVVIHLDLHGGTARKAFGGGLETYTPASAGKAKERFYRYEQGAWRLERTRTVSDDKVPTGQPGAEAPTF